MPDTGFVLAGLGFSSTTTSTLSNWTNSSNITADDGNNAVTTLSTGNGFESDNLRGSNFGISVPSLSQVVGIELRAQLDKNSQSAQYTFANIGKASSDLGTAKEPNESISGTPTNYDLGSSSDLWGLTLSASDVNSTNFLAQIRVGISTEERESIQVDCDAMWIKVYYTISTAPLQTIIF